MRDLTPRQQGILRPIRGRMGASGLPSARAEIAQAFVIEDIGDGAIRQGIKS